MNDELLTKQNGRVLEASFNREDGACSDAMAAELSAAMLSAHETSDMVLLRSTGPDFCTGRARNSDAGKPDPEAYSRRAEYDSIFNCYKAIRNAQVPIVGVIEGRCMGFGTAVASLCDVSFASSRATFNIPEIAHNVMPTMVMSALYDRINRNAIMWMTYTTKFIDADRALNYGFISQVVDPDKLNAEVDEFCETLLSRPRPAILGLKEYLHVAPKMDELGAIDYARALHSMVNTAADMKK
jgi:enoyl-CoA hydratase